jgi:TPR repeat protein
MSGQESTSITLMHADAKNALAIGDYVTAREKYEYLAKLGSKEAILALGVIFERGGAGVAQDYTTARYWFERAWAEGDLVYAARALARFYYMGLGVPINYEKSYSYLARFENTDSAVILLRLGCMYERGEGVPKDLDRARALYRRSAQLKNIHARRQLGLLALKRGNIIVGIPLFISALIHGVILALFKGYDNRLLMW